MLCIHIHTIVIFQAADFGQRMSRASNSVVYARALWRSIRDSKSLGEGPDRSSIAVPTAIEKACCSYAHTWIAMLIYVFYLRWTIIYIYFYRYFYTSLASSNQQISTDTTGDWESPPLCPLRWWHTFGHLRSLGQVLGLPYYALYLLPARFWELAAGVILYLFCAKVMTGEWLTERICSTVVHCTGRDNEEYIYMLCDFLVTSILQSYFVFLGCPSCPSCCSNTNHWHHWLITGGAEKERIISEMLMRQPAVLALLQLWTALLFLRFVGKMEKWSIPMGPWWPFWAENWLSPW
jgi:hypothetical protein